MDIDWNAYIIWVLTLLSIVVIYCICRDIVIGMIKERAYIRPLWPYNVPGIQRPQAAAAVYDNPSNDEPEAM